MKSSALFAAILSSALPILTAPIAGDTASHPAIEARSPSRYGKAAQAAVIPFLGYKNYGAGVGRGRHPIDAAVIPFLDYNNYRDGAGRAHHPIDAAVIPFLDYDNYNTDMGRAHGTVDAAVIPFLDYDNYGRVGRAEGGK